LSKLDKNITMSRVALVTVSDDRSGRKNGKYSETQDRVGYILGANKDFGITDFFFWKWSDIVETDFYVQNKKILDQIDPAMNGRCYKPFAIKNALENLDDGDFLIYNDVSPEWWPEGLHKIDPSVYSLEVIKNLCIRNGGILSADVNWHACGGLGDHTHENFTTERCMQRMGMSEYRHGLQHASGMIVLLKSEKSLDFINEWLKWNLIDECASLGSVESEPVPPERCICEYWHEEVDKYGKIGPRHDQSISGLLINRMNNKLIKNVGNYNFLDYCRIGYDYEFIESNLPASEFIYQTKFIDDRWQYIKSTRN
jgi:hypothetical protein